MYRIAVIGDRDSIYGFATLGLDVYPVSSPEEGAKEFKRIAADKYAVIYVTEALQAQIEPEIEKFKQEKLPAIIAIPGVSGNTGKGILNVKKLVEQAVGSDIIFNNEK